MGEETEAKDLVSMGTGDPQGQTHPGSNGVTTPTGSPQDSC